MTDNLILWGLIVACGLLTFSTRFLPLTGLLPKQLPPVMERAMHYVPVAVLTPIVIYGVFLPEGSLMISDNMRILAALLALIATLVTGRVIVTILVGMGSLWLLEMLILPAV